MKFRNMVSTDAQMEAFRRTHAIPDDVGLLLAPVGLPEEGPDIIHIPIMAVVEAGVRFPLDSLLQQFFGQLGITTSQVTINTFRILTALARLSRNADMLIPLEILTGSYLISFNTHSRKYFLQRRPDWASLIKGLSDSDKGASDYLIVSGNYQATDGPYQVPTRVADLRKCRIIFCLFYSLFIIVDLFESQSTYLSISSVLQVKTS